MNFLNHDFAHNFTGVVKSMDPKIQKSFIISEMARSIATNRKEFIDMMRMAGIDIADNINDVDLTDAVIENIGKNKKFASGVSFLIVSNNEKMSNADNGVTCPWWKQWFNIDQCKKKKEAEIGPPTEDQFMKNTADSKQSASTGGSTASGIISGITNLVGGIFNYATEKEKGKNQAESDKMQLMQSLMAMKTAQTNKPNNTGMYVLLGLVLLGGAAITIFYFVSKKKTATIKS